MQEEAHVAAAHTPSPLSKSLKWWVTYTEAEAKQLATTVNDIKAEIDAGMAAIARSQEAREAISSRRSQLTFEEDVVPHVEEEQRDERAAAAAALEGLVCTLKDAKVRYRAAYAQLQQARERVQYLKTVKAQRAADLLQLNASRCST